MRVSIHQPHYLPHPRYIHKIMSADLFIYLDTISFSKNSYQNRNMIKNDSGSMYLTLPVKQSLGQKIKDVELSTSIALKKHWKSISNNYSRSKGFKLYSNELAALYNQCSNNLCEISINIITWLLEKTGINTKCIRASGINGIDYRLSNSKLISNICNNIGCTTYLSGTGGKNYIDVNDFCDIDINIQEWKCIPYNQQFRNTMFIEDLSIIDLFLNNPECVKKYIHDCGGWNKWNTI